MIYKMTELFKRATVAVGIIFLIILPLAAMIWENPNNPNDYQLFSYLNLMSINFAKIRISLIVLSSVVILLMPIFVKKKMAAISYDISLIILFFFNWQLNRSVWHAWEKMYESYADIELSFVIYSLLDIFFIAIYLINLVSTYKRCKTQEII